MSLRWAQWPAYKRLMRTDRPIGTYLLAWPTLWALWIAAEGMPSFRLLFVFLSGVFLMRSAGCVINDYADRNIDAHITRTADRPFAKRDVSESEALQLFLLLLLCAANLLWLTNWLTIKIALLAAALTVFYPFMKRYTHLPQIVLGGAFSCAIPMAFAATKNSVPAIAWLLFFAVVTWVVVYDTFYAMSDRDEDIKIGVKSTAILFGRYDRILTTVLQIVFLCMMLIVGKKAQLGIFYFLSLIWVAKLFVDQQRMISSRDKQMCFEAFLHNNKVGMSIFSGIVLHYFFR